MLKKKEKEFSLLTDQALRLAWKIGDCNDASYRACPSLRMARQESILAFRCTILVLRTIFRLESECASVQKP